MLAIVSYYCSFEYAIAFRITRFVYSHRWVHFQWPEDFFFAFVYSENIPKKKKYRTSRRYILIVRRHDNYHRLEFAQWLSINVVAVTENEHVRTIEHKKSVFSWRLSVKLPLINYNSGLLSITFDRRNWRRKKLRTLKIF